MTPHATDALSSALASDHGAGSIGDGFAHAGIIGALLEALNAPERFQLVHCGGELFIEPVSEI
jgi:hypothetical protein